jgi:predicted anti-sigma-YlaC factor YlaD
MDMTRFPTGVLCERARTWAALAPDGELSELERHLLDAHLVRCAACSRFSVEVASIALELRHATPEPLPRLVSIPMWRRRQRYARMRTVGAAAAVAVMALGIASRAPLTSGDHKPLKLRQITDFSDNVQREDAQFRSLRHAGIFDSSRSPRHLAV